MNERKNLSIDEQVFKQLIDIKDEHQNWNHLLSELADSYEVCDK